MRAPEDLHDDGMWMQLEEMGERPDLLTDPFLDDEINMVPPGHVRLKLEVMDFDYVGEHDLSGYKEVN